MKYRSRNYNSSYSNSGTWRQCGCCLAVFVFNLMCGGVSVNFLLETFIHKSIPFWGAILIGLFVAQVSVPAAVIVWVLRLFNIL